MPRRLIAVLAAAVLTGCPSSPPATSPPDATTSTPHGPVRGEARIDVVSTSAGPIVFHNQPAPAADGGAVGAFATGVVAWLDRHLTDLQAGGPGLLAEVAAPGLLPGAPAESVTAVTGALASPQRPVATAAYHVVVAQEGPPLWARVNLAVQPDGGAPVSAGFVFTPGPPLVLVALQGSPPGAAP